jgi:adenosylcobinamide kinase / adenosylcobinamide-phosphate guanylyltransferase
MLTFLTGGARSGKSTLAVTMAGRSGLPVVFVATARPDGDDEWRQRIERHRDERPGHWSTIEEPVDIAAAVATPADGAFLVVDCLTLWLANLLDTGAGDDDVLAATNKAIDAARQRSGPVVGVSNEVGSGIVPVDAATRRFRDALGRVNAEWAGAADRAYLVVAGRALPLRELDG